MGIFHYMLGLEFNNNLQIITDENIHCFNELQKPTCTICFRSLTFEKQTAFTFAKDIYNTKQQKKDTSGVLGWFSEKDF